MGIGIFNFLDTTDSSSLNKYTVDVYGDLLNISNPVDGDLAHVRRTTGALNPFANTDLKGLYEFNDGTWEYASEDLQNELVSQQLEIDSNDVDILAIQNEQTTQNNTLQDLETNKLDKGGYTGTAQDLKDDIDNSGGGGGVPTGTYTGTGEDLDNDNRGTVNIHSDVELAQNVVPVDGWIPKWVDGQLILCMYEHFFYKGNPVINTIANNDINNTPLRRTFNFQRTGNYKITIKASHSVDSTGADMVLLPSIDGFRLPDIFGGEMIRQEGKDSAGNNNDGRGTDQKNTSNGVYHYFATTIGDKEILLDHYCNIDGVEASVWDVFIEVEEIIRPRIIS